MPTTANSPRWWQRLIPRYGNWGGVGWSAGRWNNDPALTDWSVEPVDALDAECKFHDWAYQHNFDRDAADWNLVRGLKGVRPATLYGKFYRLLAMAAFTVWPRVRRLLGMIGVNNGIGRK